MVPLHIKALIVLLICLIALSAFFSAAETSMMALNRYRLRSHARKGHRTAKQVVILLEHPERLLGMVLLCNQFSNILASSIATVIAIHYLGSVGVIIATIALTVVTLIMGETAPKTFAVSHPLKIAYACVWILNGLLFILYPIVFVINLLSNAILSAFGIKIKKNKLDPLSTEELRTLVLESTGKIAHQYQHILLRILDLEKVTVEDVMVPRNDIQGIDLNEDWSIILNKIYTSEYNYLPVYKDTVDHVRGVLEVRKFLSLRDEPCSKENLLRDIKPPYFIPEAALLSRQLPHFQHENQEFALVVDEYGEIQGLVTRQDMFNEIVGEFTDDTDPAARMVRQQRDGSVIVDASITIRELNRITNWALPLDGAKTLSGMITHHLEIIPQSGVSCRVHDYPMEIVKANANTAQLVQVWPALKTTTSP